MVTGQPFDVSIVIPLYNKARFITSTLDTVLTQTLKPREVIIVDDGSSDESATIVAAYADKNPASGIRLVAQRNAGPGPARNRGIAEAAGEWIAFIDADDRWAQNHLATLSNVVAALPEVAIIAGSHQRLTAAAPLPPPDLAPKTVGHMDFFCADNETNSLWTSGTAVRREALLNVGGFSAFFPGEDVDLWFRLALDHAVGRSTRCTSFYTQHTGGIMEAGEHTKALTFDGWPLGRSIDQALADQRYQSKHSQISALKVRLMMNSVKQELYRGNTARARMIIYECMPGGITVPLSYRLLAILPPCLLRPSVRLAARLRSLLRSTFAVA